MQIVSIVQMFTHISTCYLQVVVTASMFGRLQAKYNKQAERLKSRERRPEVNRLNAQGAQWLIGSMVDRLDGR